MLTLPALLAGCSDGVANSASWAVVLVVALAAVAAAYLLGATRSRVAGQMALRAARADASQQAQLQDGTPWQTDTAHRLATWCGGNAIASAQQLFADPNVRAYLETRRSFTEQRVFLGLAVEGSCSWLMRGVPRHDDLGVFCGFTGIARPLQSTDEQQTRAAALQTLLGLQPGPALLALNTGNGWVLQQCNSAARGAWPQLMPGLALPAALGAMPEAAALAFAECEFTPSSSPASASMGEVHACVDIDGWQLQPCEGLPAGWRGLLMVQRPLPAIASKGTTASAATAAAAEAAAVAAAEAENETASFSFTLSHDLRAPIRVVEGFTRIVKEDYGRLLDRVGNDHLDRVLSAAARMNLMIDALLTLARLSSQPLARQPVNLSQLAAFVVDDLRRTTPEREVEVEIEPGLSTHGDPTLLRLVLENLLGNAWKYTGRTAKARLSLGVMPNATPSDASGARTTYVMRDNGAGFDMRSSERLFGLFQRLHSASEFPGHGVGLASVRRIVRRHGGDIWAEAEPGRGAAFYFTLAA